MESNSFTVRHGSKPFLHHAVIVVNQFSLIFRYTMACDGDGRVLRSFDFGWGFFDVDVQDGDGGEGVQQDTQEAAEHVMDQNDDAEVLPLGQCSFCENHGCRELTDDEKEIGFARFAKKVTHACENDYQKNFVKYSFFNGNYCCDPLSLHKKRVPNKLTLITLQMHHLKKSLVPGKKLCKKCLERFQEEISTQQESDGSQDLFDPAGGGGVEDFDSQSSGPHEWSQDMGFNTVDSQSSGPHEWSQDRGLETVNSAFDLLDESPVKKYKLGSDTYVEGKISSINKKIRDQLKVGEPEKDTDIEGFLTSLKEKFAAGDRDDKYRCLTLCPPSWDAKKLMATFNCSRYLALNALELRAEQGPGAFPGKKHGRGLPNDTLKKVTSFYLDQDISRNLPGKRDVVMVRGADGKREGIQKRLLLSNLNEAFVAFKMRFPQVNVGFSKFAELRPPQVILPGQSGTHRFDHRHQLKLMFNILFSACVSAQFARILLLHSQVSLHPIIFKMP